MRVPSAPTRNFRHPGNGYTYLGFHNAANPALRGPARASGFASRTQARVIDGVRVGLAREATGPYKAGTWALQGQGEDLHRSTMDTARRLLAEAGWKHRNETDSSCANAAVHHTFGCWTNHGNDLAEGPEIVQRSCSERGVAWRSSRFEWAPAEGAHIKAELRSIVLGWGHRLDRPTSTFVWHSSQPGPLPAEHISYSTPRSRPLLEAGRTHLLPRVAREVLPPAPRPRRGTGRSGSSTSPTRCPSCLRACPANRPGPDGIRYSPKQMVSAPATASVTSG